MAKQYEWRADLRFEAGDPDWLTHGVTPATQTNWQTADVGTAVSPGAYTYWYRDSNTSWQGHYQDVLSSRVALVVTQTWNTSVDSRNNLTVTISTVVNSIDRDDIRAPAGYSDQNTPGRIITLYREQGGTVVWGPVTDNLVATAHNLSGTIDLGTETFTLAPGDATVVKPSLYLHNQVVGGVSYDDIWLGIQFRNILPADYRAGQIWNEHEWLSHNRSDGWAGIWDGSSFREMRTNDGPEGVGNPPLIRHADGFHNQRLIGNE